MVQAKPRDFERPIDEIEEKLARLRSYGEGAEGASVSEIEKLEHKRDKLVNDIFSKLTPWQITEIARHPKRPYTLDYIEHVFSDFTELHGDRLFKDDPAIVGGLARIGGTPVVIIGQQKGRTTKERVKRNYGMPHPEGYRKALRLMQLAERFKRPIITFIDTPGAAPDIEAEERGQSVAIAENLLKMSTLKTPIVSVVIGEGGSGGALAIGVADRVMMLEYSTYSVISPEGCAAILWKDNTKADIAAKALRLNSKELLKLGIIDSVIKEPLGGAHRDLSLTSKNLEQAILDSLRLLRPLSIDELVESRYNKFRKIGVFTEVQ
jgi:acetyl-CoA carboxylase carboxyl transferase subunit alpha